VLSRQRDKVCYLFANRQVKKTKDIADYTSILDDPKVWYLVDNVPDPGAFHAKTIFTCSPRRSVFKEFQKLLLLTTLYLPTWEYWELLKLTEILDFEKDLMFRRLLLVGGIPRLIFSQDNLEKTISDAIYRSSFENCTQVNGILESSEDISHVLVHLKPNEDYFDGEPTVQFGSSEIELKLVEHFKEKDLQKIKSFIGSSSQLTISGSLRGGLFEGWADHILSRGGSFSIRCLRTSKVFTLNLPELQKVVTPKFVESGAFYYKPLDKDSFPCVDAWIPTIGFFQMTTTLSHPIKERGIASLLKQTEMKDFYFVVPDQDDLFDKFNWQPFIVPKKESSKGKAKRRKVIGDEDIGTYADQLNQYVLKILI